MASICATAWVAAGLQCLRGNRCRNGFGILMYHRVAERISGVDTPTSNVTPHRLRRQLAGLLDLGFEAWSLSKLAGFHRASRPIPHNVFAVTFDDGYENNYTNAWPVLRELNVPATIFIATKYLDSNRPFPFDAWSAAGGNRVPTDAWRPLSTGQCNEMLSTGLIELGAHTHSHERFLGRSGEFRRDMALCLGELDERFGIVEPTFAYPYGDVNAELADVARQLGVACSVTTRHQQVRATDDICRWGRFYAGATDTPAILAAILSGWYSTVAAAGKTLARPFSHRGLNAGRPTKCANSLQQLEV
jgi:peptidoglycan/xylan/chitin deacetylase (PgdA/CDA1 family)